MKVRAPGKIVVSGAYSVLYGAPAIVAAVDRYVVADPASDAEHVSDEVAAAIELGLVPRACRVDVHDLFDDTDPSRKLGLGASAAIVASTLAAVRGTALDDPEQRFALFDAALAAHKHAQPLGSGIDVAASVFGGFVRCQKQEDGLVVAPFAGPAPLTIAVYAHPEAARTHTLLERMRAFEATHAATFGAILSALVAAATLTVAAVTTGELLRGLRRQDAELRRLDAEAEMGIFVPAFDKLAIAAARENAFFGPSGAGGGDVGIFVGKTEPTEAFENEARSVGVRRVRATVGVGGVEAVT